MSESELLENANLPWNDLYQQLSLLPSSSSDRTVLLRKLMDNFLHVSYSLARVIVEEQHLPVSQRRFRPEPSVGGVAGGEKYRVGQLFVKFARDWKRIYGSDELAIKAASNEVRSIALITALQHADQSVFLHQHTTLTVSLMIDGHALIVTAAAPVAIFVPGLDTLMYGSSDAGKSLVQKASIGFHDSLARICDRLHLADHTIQTSDGKLHQIRTAADVEAHLGVCFCCTSEVSFFSHTRSLWYSGGWPTLSHRSRSIATADATSNRLIRAFELCVPPRVLSQVRFSVEL